MTETLIVAGSSVLITVVILAVAIGAGIAAYMAVRALLRRTVPGSRGGPPQPPAPVRAAPRLPDATLTDMPVITAGRPYARPRLVLADRPASDPGGHRAHWEGVRAAIGPSAGEITTSSQGENR